MTPEEIKALIEKVVSTQMAEGLKSGFDTFREYFTEQITPLTAQITAFEEAMTAPEEVPDTTDTTTPEEMSDPATKALKERVELLEAQALEREAQAAKARFSTALRAAISPENPLHGAVVEELLGSRLAGLVETDGAFYNAKGEKLSELVAGFFQTPEGQHFKPARTKQGVGETPGTGVPPTPPKGEPTLDEMLLDISF